MVSEFIRKFKGNVALLEDIRVAIVAPDGASSNDKKQYTAVLHGIRHTSGTRTSYVPLAFAASYSEEELRDEAGFGDTRISLLENILTKHGLNIGDTRQFRNKWGFSTKPFHHYATITGDEAVRRVARTFHIPYVEKTTPLQTRNSFKIEDIHGLSISLGTEGDKLSELFSKYSQDQNTHERIRAILKQALDDVHNVIRESGIHEIIPTRDLERDN